MTRQRHEASIKRLERYTIASFERALMNIMFARGVEGRFDFFTDEQIADIRSEMGHMAVAERRRWRMMKERRAALRSIAMQDETGRVEAMDMVGCEDE